jgi:menaquinone-dependent protoporphyrinogen oxidase
LLDATTMKPILVLYATREGQTRRIAEHVVATLRSRGAEAETFDVANLREPVALEDHAAAILAASVHAGQHEREMVDFVKRHRAELDRIPTAFLSVSLSEATVEGASYKDEDRAKARADVQGMIDTFLQRTGWRPRRLKAVAGALLYTQYGVIKRLMMRLIVRKTGATDMSRDYEYTDWAALDGFIGDLAAEVAGAERPAASAAPASASAAAAH